MALEVLSNQAEVNVDLRTSWFFEDFEFVQASGERVGLRKNLVEHQQGVFFLVCDPLTV